MVFSSSNLYLTIVLFVLVFTLHVDDNSMQANNTSNLPEDSQCDDGTPSLPQDSQPAATSNPPEACTSNQMEADTNNEPGESKRDDGTPKPHQDSQAAATSNPPEVNTSKQTEADTNNEPGESKQDDGTSSPTQDNKDDIYVLETTESSSGDPRLHGYAVYSDTYDWRRYVPPMPDREKHAGWCVMRDLLLAMPISVFLNIVSLPIEVSRKYF